MTFVAGSFTDTGGSTNQTEVEEFTVQTPSGALTGPEHGQVVDREAFQDGTTGDITIDVEYTPTSGASVDITTLGSNDLTLSGAGLQNLTFVSVTQLGPNSFRYRYTGSPITTGKVTVSFNQDGWRDTAGNQSGAAQRQFAVITQAAVVLHRALRRHHARSSAGILDEPLIEAKATVTSRSTPRGSVFTLSFTGELKIIKLGTVGATAGRFVLDMSDTPVRHPAVLGRRDARHQLPGARAVRPLPASRRARSRSTRPATQKIETLTLPGLGAGGADLTRLTLRPTASRSSSSARLRLRPPGIDDRPRPACRAGSSSASARRSSRCTSTASLSFGIGDAQLTYGEATGLS